MAVIGTKNGYSILNKWPGIKPALRDNMLLRDKAMSGDMVLSFNTQNVSITATTATGTWTKTVVVTLKDAAGNTHDWFCGYMKCALSDASSTAAFSITGGKATTIYLNGGTTSIVLVSTTGPYTAATTVGFRVWRTDLLANPVTTVAWKGTFA